VAVLGLLSLAVARLAQREQRLPEYRIHGNPPPLPGFRLPNVDRAAVKVDVRPSQLEQFALTQSGVQVCQHEDVVLQGEGLKQAGFLFVGQVPHALVVLLELLDPDRGIRLGLALLDRVIEGRTDDSQIPIRRRGL
jgi:hypothetical protein